MRKILPLFLGLFCVLSLQANNIEVSNVTLTGQNTIDNYTLVQFDLTWENSWRISSGPSNYDGAWVFIKFRTTGGDWRHGELNYVDGTAANDGHTEPSNGTIRTAADGTGAFIYRNADGSGDINFQTIQLRWDYGASSVSDGAVVDVQVFAIEMVYIPTSTFQAGASDGSTEISHFYYNTGVFGAQSPFPITSEGAITVSSAIGPTNFWYDFSLSGGDQSGPIPAAFPKGFAAFWVMKYEITEDQYVCFFNTLTQTQKTANDVSANKGTDSEFERNTFSWTSGNATSTAGDRACSFMSYANSAAYLDWAGLRFMTELEFEKAAKGPLSTDEMLASGRTNAYSTFYTIANDGQENSIVTNPGENITNINYSFTSLGGPMRAGIFAASSPNNTREESGGSYYGVMEMSGNLFERTMSVGTPLNRAYQGTHGDGTITVTGNHNVLSWPGNATAGASGYKGGSWDGGIFTCRIADRQSAALTSNPTNGLVGVRGARTAN